MSRSGPLAWPAEVVAALRCPVCAHSFALGADESDPFPTDDPARSGQPPRTVRCGHGHSFDIARQGYLNLAGGTRTGSGDTAPMVAARERFLADGHFETLRTAVVRATGAAEPVVPERAGSGTPAGLVVDAGAGTGWYLRAVLTALADTAGLALDTSKYAARRAARAHPRLVSVVGDVWGRLPVADGVATVLLNVFAPRNGPEFRRVLRRDGALVVVTPAATHLRELHDVVDVLTVDSDKQQRLETSLGGDFWLERTEQVEAALALSRTDVARLVLMGPTGHHISPDDLDRRLAAAPEVLHVTLAAQVSRYRPA